jgi:UDP-N-acetylglucosamine--N-acetylmuramyl-(pentapeptide) pyrophosphoryl-undecaprenol N-acetylglucosamine transferase
MKDDILRRVVVAGGGTGGHLYPALALIEELKERYPQIEVSFMGSDRGIESRVIPKEGYPLRIIDVEGFVGKPFFKKLRALWKLTKSIKQSYRYLQELQPQIVIGSGGYVSFPPVLSAWLLKIPTLIMEQDTMPGVANRVLGKIANAVCVSNQDAIKYFPRHKTYLTGSPVRKKILKGSKKSALKIFSLREGLFTVFVFGGSSGAHSINTAMVEALQWLLDLKDNIQFLHQTGSDDYEFVRDAYRSYGFYGTVTPFIYQMPEAYAVADLVICRAGASTISELCATGKPSILIPYPYATSSHQLRNALRLEAIGASVVIQDRELSGERLAGEIKKLILDEDRRADMRHRALASAKVDATERIVDLVVSILKNAPEQQTVETPLQQKAGHMRG